MARKSSEKEREIKRQELLWELRVCKEAIERKEEEIAQTTRRHAIGFILRILWSAIFCAIVPILMFRMMDIALEERIPHIILLAIGISFVLQLCISKSIKKENGFTSYGGSDCLEVLSERLRVAKACLSSLEEGKELSESEKKYRLSFLDAQEKKCANCAYFGKTKKEITATYSDDNAGTSASVDYFCGKHGNMRVKKKNACDDFLSMRIAVAFDNAEKTYEKTVSSLREEDQKAASGFR